jgi:hypothetical protein
MQPGIRLPLKRNVTFPSTSAVDRSVTPWVVAFSHKSFQMDQTTWSMHDFITTFKVDWWFVGHWHQYTRYPPISSLNNKVVIDSASISADKSVYTNPMYPTLVVIGAPLAIDADSFSKGAGNVEEVLRKICEKVHAYGDVAITPRVK